MKHFQRFLCALMVLVLCFGMVPYGYATETEPTAALETVPETTTETTDMTEAATEPTSTEFTEPTELTESTEPMESTESVMDDDFTIFSAEDDGLMLAASTSSGIYLFDLATPYNYTVSLSSQVTVQYRINGTGDLKTAYVKNIGWHFARYNDVPYHNDPIYCIEPYKNYGASTPGNYMDTDVTLDGTAGSRGATVWYSLPESYRRAISLTLLFSDQMWNDSYSVTSVSRDNNPNTPLHLATQFLIYEITMGLRNASTFETNSSNGYTNGDILYKAGTQISGFASNYNSLVDKVCSAMKLPSFVGSSSSNAPTITMDSDFVSVTDRNGVLPYFSFSDGSGASFSKSGNTLYIEQTGEISSSKAFSCYRSIPSPDRSTVALYYGGASTYQTCVKLHTPSNGSLYGYFKLKAPPTTGSFSLTKTTEDGKNLSGWRFGIYSNSACTSLVSGPHTTNSSGKISVTGLSTGTYYVKELGHTDNSINALYTCSSTNPQKVTLAAGQTASVSFHNVLAMGRIEFRKTTNTGNHLGGWTFRVKDSSRNVVGDYTTDEAGYAITEDLPLGRYLVMELPTGDNYWVTELGYHDVTVTAGKTVVDTWMNKEQGLGWFHKETNTGECLEGWHITVYSDEACTKEVKTVTTNEEGKIGHYFDPGTYWARETGDEHGRFQDPYWQIDRSVQRFEIRPHEDTSVTFTNTHMGKLKIIKTVEGNGSVEGWQFKIMDADGKELDGSPFTTDKDGMILTGNLLPGQYIMEELLPEDSLYQCQGNNPQTVTVSPGETMEVPFVNALRPGKIAVQKVDITGEPLAGATFLLEWSEDGSAWKPVFYSDTSYPVKGGCSNPDLEAGCLTSGEDGLLEWNNLHPGLHYRLTETQAPDGYALLKKPAFTGQLPGDDLTVEMRVVNARIFTMPDTGANDLFLLPTLGYLILSALILLLGRKRKGVI